MTAVPLVDIPMATYNHGKFIAQAIESVLAQKTDFEFRLIIGDDCSTDDTQAIVSDYARRHPGRIETLFHPERLGVAHRDRVGVKLLRLCKAKYVSMLDGDDYWTSPYKLQKQVDFLEARPEFSMCFHDASVIYQDGSEPTRNMCRPDQKEVTTLEDLLAGNFIPTCSVLFRGALLAELPDWFFDMPTGDWPLNVLNAERGKVGYINEVMAAYRVHRGGYWSTQDYFTCMEKEMKIFEAFNRHFNYRYQRIISSTLAKRCKLLAEEYERRGDLGKAKTYALRCLVERIRDRRGPSFLPFMLLRLHAPTLYGILRHLKRTFTVGHVRP